MRHVAALAVLCALVAGSPVRAQSNVTLPATSTPVKSAPADAPAALKAPINNGQPREVPVFWVVGQSNAEGATAGYWLSNPFNAGGRFYHLHDQPNLRIWWPGHSRQRPASTPAWEPYRTGFLTPVNNATYYIVEGACGSESSFGEAAVRVLGESVYLLKFTHVAALNPDATVTFSKRADRETLYDELISEWRLAASRLRADNLVPKVRGVLWLHGEFDLTTSFAPAYGRHLDRLIRDLRADILRLDPDNGTVRFVMSEVHDRHVPASFYRTSEALIRAGQLQVARSVPDVAIADVDDLPLDTSSPNYVHFAPAGQIELGYRLFAAWRSGDGER